MAEQMVHPPVPQAAETPQSPAPAALRPPVATDLAFAGGGGLDRLAALRGDAAAQVALLAEPATGVLLFWRGKLLIGGAAAAGPGEADERAVSVLAPGHALLAEAGLRIFLGRDGSGRAWVAAEISAWEPGPAEPAIPGTFFDPTEQVHPLAPAGHRFAELRGVMSLLPPLEAELAATARALFAWHGSHGFCAACGQPSQPVMAGWQRDCPACGAHHFPRTDPVVIMLVTRGNRALLGRSPGWPEGMYSCLAGFMEPGETLEAAVRREVAEETAVAVGEVRFMASQPWPWPASLMLGCHGTAISEEIRIDPAEIEHALWVTREELAQAFAGLHPVIRPPRQGAVAAHLLRRWLADEVE